MWHEIYNMEKDGLKEPRERGIYRRVMGYLRNGESLKIG